MQENDNDFYYTEDQLKRFAKQGRYAGEGKWYEIHTNGAVITFAMFHMEKLPRDNGDLVIAAIVGVFQKLQVDITTGTAEVFGREEFDEPSEAEARLRKAREEGI